MTNSSATGGPLLPTNTVLPLDDDALDDFLQGWMVGVTGLPASLVRPAWQPIAPESPAITVDWLAFHTGNFAGDWLPAVAHVDGMDIMQRNEEFDLVLQFYGPNASKYQAILRDGAFIAQNRELLAAQRMGVVDFGQAVRTAEQINDDWVRRVDVTVHMRRLILRTYAVLDLLASPFTVSLDKNPPESDVAGPTPPKSGT